MAELVMLLVYTYNEQLKMNRCSLLSATVYRNLIAQADPLMYLDQTCDGTSEWADHFVVSNNIIVTHEYLSCQIHARLVQGGGRGEKGIFIFSFYYKYKDLT